MFVPRSVGKKRSPALIPDPTPPSVSESENQEEIDEGKEHGGTASSTVEVEKQLAAMLNLSLTNYSIWDNNELRRLLETREGGWISLALLMKQSPWFSDCDATENEIIRAYRTYGNSSLEIQMVVKGRTYEFTDKNLYNVRRKDWEAVSALRLRYLDETFWDESTIYIENIPPQYRQPSYKLVVFLQEVASLSDTPLAVQSVYFPPKEGSTVNEARCRGFAFVVCGSAEQAIQVSNDWSWNGVSERISRVPPQPGVTVAQACEDMRKLAVRCGFRALSKLRWTELKEEYLAYQKRILASNALTASSKQTYTRTSRPRNYRVEENDISSVTTHISVTPPAPSNASYHAHGEFPPGCLIFVRNLHPETNKTTIKSLLSRAFGVESDGKELDYVDFGKGMDSCHIRLSRQGHADTLHKFFSENRLAQTNGLDHTGTSPSSPGLKSIEVDVVSGKLEQFYWEKVPANIRRNAVAKAAGDRGMSECRNDEKKQGGWKRSRKV